MNYILFDGPARNALLPFTFTRPVADIRVGILTIKEKWEKLLNKTVSTLTQDYLSVKFPLVREEENILINASFLPEPVLVDMIKQLKPGEAILLKEAIVAYHSEEGTEVTDFSTFRMKEYEGGAIQIKNTWDIFSRNGEALLADFRLLTKGRKSMPVPDGVQVIAPENIFIEEGAKLYFTTLNASDGPIYIGKNTLVMEGCHIRGGFALCEGSIVKMGAKIYGATTVGPYCKVGGEINNSVLFSYSNKGHEGFLGNAVLGEWCNIGADSNNSNMKNNYDEVKLWSYEEEEFRKTGLQFCGLMMGDHSKCGINTMFNTGTVVGVNTNIYGSGLPRNFIPDFSWGGASGFSVYVLSKAIASAQKASARRNATFTEEDAKILEYVFEATRKWRRD
ncbi:glucose-1-phosphate thymidylyltransferase [Sinomicrobium pectinilyticum]|uniref:Glucose-1-phosphate thymidylyltransferase n=1 Tax=Sinomicrobium pectinilyticum TaxID=1084421 RepID=A0A3N0DFI0_SINP1|nr:GlmU family protein [Sinomicrobium pectinilyticum]RNL74428.1 glucose-1-phosphate thymidylyltransferase [Sinomicrobium pectinilyticum]